MNTRSISFATEAERLAHPEAHLIPQDVWRSIFDQTLPDNLIPLMQAQGKEAVLSCLDQDPSLYEPQRAWLAIVYSHPALTSDFATLKAIAKKLGMEDELQYKTAAISGNVDYLKWLPSTYETQKSTEEMRRYDEDAFQLAASNGHLSVLAYLESKAPEKLQAMIASDDYEAFQWAASNGHLSVLAYLESKVSSDTLQTIIASDDYWAFRLAAQNGHLPVLKYLESKVSSDILQAMIASADYETFQRAASNGHLPVLKYLESKVSSDILQAMIASADYAAFQEAASNGHLPVLKYLESKVSSDILQAMIASADYAAFQEAASNGHTSAINHLLTFPNVFNWAEQHTSVDYWAFRLAAQNGHLPVLEYLESKAPEKLQAMIKSDDYETFQRAASNGHLPVLKYLESKVSSDILQAMIASADYAAFQEAASNGHLPVLEYLESKVSSDILQAMIASADYAAFQEAASNGHTSAINHLLTFPNVFNWAEQHTREYGRVIRPFVAAHLAQLQQQRHEFEAANPGMPFDIVDPTQASLLFYILRHLIRENSPDPTYRLDMLIHIPSVRALIVQDAHLELLDTAIQSHHEEAMGLLRAIPEVAQFEAAHPEEGLQHIADDAESAIALSRALGPVQHQAFEALRSQYAVNDESAEGILDRLSDALKARYEKEPASFIRDSEEKVLLPLTWEAFQAMLLGPEERERAFQAYYQHPDHNAFRYLSKPNPWIDPGAPFTAGDPRDEAVRWADLGAEDKRLIATLYCYATDESIPLIKEYTPETRLGCLVEMLATANRVHNLDEERYKRDKKGDLLQDKNGNLLKEDDGGPDKPSCMSGAGGHYLQALTLLQQSTQKESHIDFTSLAKAEIEKYIRLHFQETLGGNQEAKELLVKYYINGKAALTTEEAIATLKVLNITEVMQQTFKAQFFAEHKQFKEADLGQAFEALLKVTIAPNATLGETEAEPHFMRAKLGTLMPDLTPESSAAASEEDAPEDLNEGHNRRRPGSPLTS